MKRKGLKKSKVQVTFEGDHPSSGCVMGFTWEELKRAIERYLLDSDDSVISFKVTERGIDVYHDKLYTYHEGLERWNKFVEL